MTRQQTKNRFSRPIFFGLILLGLLVCAASAQQPKRSNWRRLHLPLDETITGVCFPTTMDGYLVTSGGKYGVTRDGGHTWNAYNLPGASGLEDVWFKSKDTGLIVGRKGGIYRTVNGGMQWEKRTFKDTLTWFTSGLFLNDTIALVAGFRPDSTRAGKLYRSVDGAKYFDSIPVVGLGFGELFYKKGVPVCFQSYGKLHYSQDLGKTWKSLTTLAGKPGRSTAFFDKTGVICGNSGMLAISKDRGATWHSIEADKEVDFTSAALVSDAAGFIAGTQGLVMVTVDSGKTWTKMEEFPVPTDIAKLTIGGDMLFAVGAEGSIYSMPLTQALIPPKVKPKSK